MVAAADLRDPQHAAATRLLGRRDLTFVVPAMAGAEAAHLVATRGGSRALGRFLRGLADFSVEAPTRPDLLRMAELVEEYADFPLDAADASIVALAERLNLDTIATFDHRHFRAVRPRHVESFRLLPD